MVFLQYIYIGVCLNIYVWSSFKFLFINFSNGTWNFSKNAWKTDFFSEKKTKQQQQPCNSLKFEFQKEVAALPSWRHKFDNSWDR